MRFNALRAKDRGTYVLHMDRNARGGQTLFRLQVTISIQVLGVCAARPPISRVPPRPLIAFFRLCPCDRFRAPCLDCTALRCAPPLLAVAPAGLLLVNGSSVNLTEGVETAIVCRTTNDVFPGGVRIVWTGACAGFAVDTSSPRDLCAAVCLCLCLSCPSSLHFVLYSTPNAAQFGSGAVGGARQPAAAERRRAAQLLVPRRRPVGRRATARRAARHAGGLGASARALCARSSLLVPYCSVLLYSREQ